MALRTLGDSTVTALEFDFYILVGPRGPLIRYGLEIPLRAKTLQVLWYLATHAGDIVEQRSLIAAVWHPRVVSPGVLAVSIRELRQVFGDDPKAPRYIRTVHRAGYQFLPPVSFAMPTEPIYPARDDAPFVGRETELALLNELYQRACQGQRQIFFVTGEAGIGKSALVQSWSQRFLSAGEIWLGLGQCVEHGGTGEAYLCILDALNRLCRGPDRETVIATLREQAPGWLAQLPPVNMAAEREAVQPPPVQVSTQHYQRELADALDALGTLRPMVLVLEDLHWCDGPSIEALAVLARRPESARLFVICTSRPVRSTTPGHPLRSLKQELGLHGQCAELALEGLDEAAVQAYVARRLPSEAASALAPMVFRRTSGQPLFMANLIDYFGQDRDLTSAMDTGTLITAAAALPSGLLQLIETQIEDLSATEQQVLEAASVAGPTFAVAAITAAFPELPEHQVEWLCAELARRDQFILARGAVEWPDGTPSETFAFRHGLYQEVFYRRVGINRRMQLHRAIGERLEKGYEAKAASLAVELAEHFEQGRDYCRALPYHRLAGETALKRSAPVVAQTHIDRGLELLKRCPRDTEHAREELHLQLARGAALISIDGFGTLAVAQAYGRAHALCQQQPSSATLGPVLCGLWNYFLTRAEFPQVRALADDLRRFIERADADECLTPARNAIGQSELYAGEPARALVHVDASVADYDRHRHRELASRYGEDPLVVCHMYAALACWLVGYADKAAQHIEQGLAYARELNQPFGVAQMLWAAMLISRDGRNPAATQTDAQVLMQLCEQYESPFWLGGGRMLHGWAVAMQGHTTTGIAAIRQGLAEADATGAALIRPFYLGLLAEALGHAGSTQDALATVDEALATMQRTDERWYEAELWRLSAELSSQAHPSDSNEVAVRLHRALAVARRQQAIALELRAALSLARLWSTQQRPREALDLLTSLLDRLVPQGETPDLKEAAWWVEQLRCDERAALAPTLGE